jgi:hypothetical protein
MYIFVGYMPSIHLKLIVYEGRKFKCTATNTTIAWGWCLVMLYIDFFHSLDKIKFLLSKKKIECI